MCDSIDKNIPLMRPTFFSENDENNPKKKNKNIDYYGHPDTNTLRYWHSQPEDNKK